MHWYKYIGVIVILIGSKQELYAKNSAPFEFGNYVLENDEAELRKNGEWFLFVEDAYAESRATGKPIMANFTGSDWCGWCIRLKNEVFKTDKFLTWAAENVVLLELDFPRKKTMSEELRVQNSSLAQAFQVSGYPTIWIFNLSYSDSENQFKIEALGKTGYVAGGPDNWILSTNAILKKQGLTKQAATKRTEDNQVSEVKKVVKDAKFRDKATSIGDVLEVIPAGKEVGVIGKSDGYYEVIYNDKLGYISELYFRGKETESTAPSINQEPDNSMDNQVSEVKKVVRDAKFRNMASSMGDVLEVIPAGKEVGVIGKSAGYYKVIYNNKVGYISEFFFYGKATEPQTSNIYQEPDNSSNIACDEIKFVKGSGTSQPPFYTYLRGLKYAVIVLSDDSTPFSALEDYLYSMGFDKVIVFDNWFLDETNNLCDLTFVSMSWSSLQNGYREIKLNFFSQCVPDGYQFSIKKKGTADGGIALNTYSYFYNALRNMQPQLKPKYSIFSVQKLDQRLSCWTELKLKDSFQTEGCDKLEGIYENSNNSEAKYRLALKRIKESYYLIYLSGATNSGNWEEGEIKAQLVPTATPLFFKAKWIMSDKSENDGFYVSFEQGIMNVIDPEKETSVYVKMFPDVTDNFTSPSGSSTSGTGFAITKNGLIVTNYHVIEGSKKIKVRGINGDFSRAYSAKLIISDRNNDLAIIKIDDYSFSSISSVPYTINTSSSSVGEDVYVLGYPLRATMGDEVKLTNGIISSKTGFQSDVTSYQISAPIQPGNSGGPLFNYKGELIGVVNAKHIGAENASYAIKASYLTNLIDLLEYPPALQKINSVSGKPFTQQVSLVKKFVYIVEVDN